MYDALYGRQSIEKKDSISVESQLEYCRYEAHGGAYIEYIDKGYSGKNTDRPGFEQMMGDIARGKIGRVIVYKLDRISRSILDFANMMEIFSRYHVGFVSCTEKFDTSTPIGRAMLNICIVFAQLERETIQKRVTDAYHARSRHGFYMGGRIPYGYRLKDTVIDNVRTSMYEEVPEESEQLRSIFSMYADRSCSLGDIVRYLDMHNIKHLRGGEWTTARLSEMLRNPVYVRADVEVYRFFKSQGAKICAPVSDFTGKNACYLYKSIDTDTEKNGSLADREVILAPHEGFISPEIWLACRERCLYNRQAALNRGVKNSWLAGKVKCGKCGYALTIRKSRTRWGRYFVCSRSRSGCGGSGCTVYADVLEDYMQRAIKTRLAGFSGSYQEEERAVPRPQQDEGKKMRLVQIEGEIEALLSKVPDADEVLMRYINERVGRLDSEKSCLQEAMMSTKGSAEDREGQITDYAKMWGSVTFEDRRAIVDIFIKVIHIADGKMEITWRI